MVLDTKTHKIQYIAFNTYIQYDYWHRRNNITDYNIQHFAKLADLGAKLNSYIYANTYSSKNMTPQQAKAIYLGEAETINAEINKKLNPTYPDKFTKVYFDPHCKYPRFKLSSLTNIKRCLNPTQADSVIISASNINTYTNSPNFILQPSDDIIILYSTIKDCYYLIDYYVDLQKYTCPSQLRDYCLKYTNIHESGVEQWISILINSQLLPSDCQIFYSGKITLLGTLTEAQFVNNLFTVYTLLTYDTDLDKYVGSNGQNLTFEDVQSLQNMLSSSDEAILDIGLKLLSTYNTQSFAGTIGTLIVINRSRIIKSKVFHSVNFKQLLSTLKINTAYFGSYYADAIINKLYTISNNPQDKEYSRKLLILQMSENIQKFWKQKYNAIFKDFKFKLKITIE